MQTRTAYSLYQALWAVKPKEAATFKMCHIQFGFYRDEVEK